MAGPFWFLHVGIVTKAETNLNTNLMMRRAGLSIH